MAGILLWAFLLLCSPTRKEGGSGVHAWALGRGATPPLQPSTPGSGPSNSCCQLDCALPGQPLYKLEASNGTSSQTDSEWSYYVIAVIVLADIFLFLYCCPSTHQCLVSIFNCFRGVTRSHPRTSPGTRTRPRNYGTLTEMASQASDPEDTPSQEGGEDSHRECDEVARGDSSGCGVEDTA